MRREIWRYTFFLLIPIFLFSLAVAAGSEPGTVDVRLTEYVIEMPQTLPPGPTTFLLHNLGHKSHSFKLEGPGITDMSPAIVKPGKTGTVQVTLQPGEYTVYCPIGNHSAKGMTTKLVVSEKKAG
jgi:plastocyanin